MTVTLQPGDVFLTRGTSFVSRAIRFFSRSVGESRTRVNHVGVVVTAGPPDEALVVESTKRVMRHRLVDRYLGSGNQVAVYRPTNVTPEEVAVIVAQAESYVGRGYGYFKVALHVLDWALLGVYLFRRLGRMGRYPICSWLVAHAFAAAGYHFGVEPGAATPDDIDDFVQKHEDKYACVRPLSPLSSP